PHHDSDIKSLRRYSTSLYHDFTFSNGWTLNNMLIYGVINGYNHSSALQSFGEEFKLEKNRNSGWGRIEVLQRTPGEIAIADSRPDKGQWLTAATAGFTRKLATWDELDVG